MVQSRRGVFYEQASKKIKPNCIKEISPGKYNVIVEGDRGIITALKNISKKSLDRLTKNYNWR